MRDCEKSRCYEKSHPWITFKATDINKLQPKFWVMLGESMVLCKELSETPIPSYLHEHLHGIYLIRGAQATTAIEGNTLTEEEVKGIHEETYKAPPSREYQEREVQNVLGAIEYINRHLSDVGYFPITAELICDLNRKILVGTHHDAEVVPGEIRTHSVVVNGYRGAPARDCEYLLNRLANWLESGDFRSDDPQIDFALTVCSAFIAHLYLAWIHPFRDGNGRTARLLESLMLARSGHMPFYTTQVPSSHYNLTRDRYYWELSKASGSRDTSKFLFYAVEGFLDGVLEQKEWVRTQQLNDVWFAYVYQTLEKFPNSPARDRRRKLALSMPIGKPVTQYEIPRLDLELASLYALKGPRTLSRDLNFLRDENLIVYDDNTNGWSSNFLSMSKFLPGRATGSGMSDRS